VLQRARRLLTESDPGLLRDQVLEDRSERVLQRTRRLLTESDPGLLCCQSDMLERHCRVL
jgi:hypothetical protein